MKKGILIFGAVLTTFGLMALSYINWNDPVSEQNEKLCSSGNSDNLELASSIENISDLDLVYNVETRYFATVNIEDLHKAKTVADVIPKEADWSKYPIRSLAVTLFDDHGETVEVGDNLIFSDAQKRLLRTTNISDNFRLIAHCKGKTKDIDEKEYDLAYWLTVTPEFKAEYIEGKDALISYLKTNSKTETANIAQEKVRSGRVNFIVTSEGAVSNVYLDSSSGYRAFDNVMLELVSNMSKKWTPASNSKGEKFDQELVVFFGTQGC